MTCRRSFRCYAAIAICLGCSWGSAMAQEDPEQPETVMVTLHAKTGAEADLERVIARH